MVHKLFHMTPSNSVSTCSRTLFLQGHHGIAAAPRARAPLSWTFAPSAALRRRRGLACRAGYEPFAFEPDDYLKCVLQVASQVDARSQGSPALGNLIFMREDDVRKGPDGKFLQIRESAFQDGKALVMAVGGDTLTCIVNLLEGANSERPYALDLLWMVLQRGQEISRKDWKLLHVAVVALKGMVFTARLFFGDPETGAIAYDCDCRPSDACWLALKTRCPVYVSKEVWETNAHLWRDLFKLDEPSLEETITTIRTSDPEPVKRLKREMEVAVSEEDYTAAARIRDHPYMMLFRRITDHEKAGRTEAAHSLRQQLDELIQDSSRSTMEGQKEM